MRKGLVICLFSALVTLLSGCLGGNGGPSTAESGSEPVATASLAGDPAPISDDNSAHHHNYWMGRTQVEVFNGSLELKRSLDGLSYLGCNSVSYADFNPESDGDDVGPQDAPVNPSPASGGPPKADAVFPGTGSLRVRFDWSEDLTAQQSVPGLVFQYRPPNMRTWQRATSDRLTEDVCGAIVRNHEWFRVPVGPLQFDPQHQFWLSRWKFQVWANSNLPSQGLPTEPPAVAQGQVRATVVAEFGGDTLLDPPHPDFFGNNDSLSLGALRRSVNASFILDEAPPAEVPGTPSSPLGYTAGIARDLSFTFPRGNIAPMGMRELHVSFCFQYGGTSVPRHPSTLYHLEYQAPDTDKFRYEPPRASESGCDTYVIEDREGTLADSPYEVISNWVFRVVPFTEGRRVGYVAGAFEASFTAVR